MTNDKKNKRERTGINLNKDLAEQIQALAREEKRTLTAQTHVLLEYALSQWNSKKDITPEWVEERFESMGVERVRRLTFSAIEYLLSGVSASTADEEGQLAIAFLQKLVGKTATDGDAIEVADALDLDTASLSELIRLMKKGRKTSNGV